MIRDEELLFRVLNEKLKEKDQHLELICVGGFVLNHYSIRATMDIDSFYSTNREIDGIIKKMGEDYSLNPEGELWLNNSVQNMNKKPPEDVCDVLYEFSNLKVLIPPLEYIACMKLASAREQDIIDVSSIIEKLNVKTPEELEKTNKAYGFGEVDDSILLEAFGKAYGMEWLEKYITKRYSDLSL